MVVNISTTSNDYGWYPKIQLKHFDEKANLIAGGELRLHNSEHYGEIMFGNALPNGTPGNYKYYFYNGKKTTASFYVNEFTNVEKKLTIMAGVQFTYHKYSIENDAFKNYNFSAEYKFLTSRVGFNYNFNDKIKVYSSVCIARREPRLKDFYDADSPNSRPNLKIVDTVNKVYSDPLVQYEELTDYEFGAGYKNEFFKSNLNFYYMDYKNEIVNSGMINNIGEPVYGNAGRTIHRGIEAEVECSLFPKLLRKIFKNNTFMNISGNLNLSDNYFLEYIETLGVDTLGNIIKGKDYSGNQIMLTPQIIGNLSLGLFSEFGFSAYITLQYIGKQYLDNSENERKDSTVRKVKGYIDKDIKPYAVFNTGISLDLVPFLKSRMLNGYFKTFEISLKVNNIFDRIYETYGSVDSQSVPRWIPAADRNYFLNLKAGF
jgi:iron complex outermembrane receptor protein